MCLRSTPPRFSACNRFLFIGLVGTDGRYCCACIPHRSRPVDTLWSAAARWEHADCLPYPGVFMELVCSRATN